MATLVLDIDTVGIEKDNNFNTLDKYNLVLSSGVISDERATVEKDRLGLSPLTGQIISLAMYDIERELGVVYFVSDKPGDNFVDDFFTYKQRTERQILEDFWLGATEYDIFVSFNGRSFVLPFLYHRSVISKLKPTVEISFKQYLNLQSMPYHVDLMNEFSFQGAMKPNPSLALLAEAYGIDYGQEIAGEQVGEFFRQKKFTDLAKRSARDVLAIKSLYQIWKENIAPKSFINATEM